MCNTFNDIYSCNSKSMHYKDWQCETQTVDLYGQILLISRLIWCLRTNGNKLLWYSQIKVKRNEWHFWEDNKTHVADIKHMMRHDLTAILWKDNMSTCWQICTKHQQSELSVTSTNMFWNQPMTNCYCHSRWTWKWAKLLILHILDISNLNSFIILIAFGSESSQKHFGLVSIRDLIQEAERLLQHLTTQPCKTDQFHPTKNT